MVQLPAPFSLIPRYPLLYSNASAIEPLNRLSDELFANDSGQEHRNVKIWIKRDDSNSGLAFGGNKVRKLEYLIPEALDLGATTLVTTGGLQSNHMRQVAAAGARCGLRTILLPQARVQSSHDSYKTTGNIQLTELLSAERSTNDADPEVIMQSCRAKGEVPYWIPSGASTHVLGGCGYARWAFELAEQERELQILFDTIVVACNSGSTLGGMIAGFKLLAKISSCNRDLDSNRTMTSSKRRRIIGVDTSARAVGELESVVFQISKTTASKIGLPETEVQQADVILDKRWHAGKYGLVDNKTLEAVKLTARLEGVIVDPVYTGKAMAALIGMARMGELQGCENVLFVHTGGVPALCAYPDVR